MDRKKLCLIFTGDFLLAITVRVILCLPFIFFVRETEYELFVAALATQAGFLAVCFYRLYRFKRIEFSLPSFFEGPTKEAIRLGVITGLVLFVLNITHGMILQSLSGIDLAEKNPWAQMEEFSFFSRLLTFIAGGLFAPVVEEFFLRGIMFGAFVAAGHTRTGVIFTTILFVGLHLDPTNSFAYAMLGLGFLWVYYRTRNLLAPIIAHGINNVVGFIFILIPF